MDIRILALFFAYSMASTLATTGFKLSGTSQAWKGFLSWQVFGNLAGFASVLVLTLLLRMLPVHIVNPIAQGFTVFVIQVFAARMFFHESITPIQWLGTALIIGGIILVGSQHK